MPLQTDALCAPRIPRRCVKYHVLYSTARLWIIMSTSQAASTEEFAALAADPAWATQYADPRTLLERAVARLAGDRLGGADFADTAGWVAARG